MVPVCNSSIQNSIENSKSVFYFDVLRVLAMIAVILNHSFGYFSYDMFEKYFGTKIYYVDCILNSFTRFDVPIFFMISGGLILSNKKCTNTTYIYRHVKKLFIPLVLWTFIYSLINSRLQFVLFARNIAGSVFHAMLFAGHLWYLYTAILLYFLTPIIKYAIDNNPKYTFFLILFIVLFYNFFEPLISVFVNIPKFSSYMRIDILSGYLLYYVLGYYLSNYTIKISNKSLIFVMTFCVFLISFLTIFLSTKRKMNISFFQDFNSIFVLFYSWSLFIFIKNIFLESNPNRILCKLSKISFGIYLVHFLFRDLFKILIQKDLISEFTYLTLSPIFVFMCSLIFCVLVSKFKNISKYLIGIN